MLKMVGQALTRDLRGSRGRNKKCLLNDYCKLKNKQQRENQDSYKIKLNYQLTHQFETTVIRQSTKKADIYIF